MTTTQIAELQSRNGTVAVWTAANPILLAGEWGYETDTGKAKLGDGVTHWIDLPYVLPADLSSYIPLAQRGAANGVATLDASGRLPAGALPGVGGDASGTLGALAVNTVQGGKAPVTASVGDRSVVKTEPVPTFFYNVWQGINGGPNNIVTARGFEYMLVNRDNNKAAIFQRAVGTPTWSAPTDLSGIFGTTLLDGHCFYAVGVDANGFIHVSGNLHAVALKYARSTAADSIASFTTSSMTGVNENRVTYPQFLGLPNGKLGFFYRNGVSGDGNAYLKSYDLGTQTWTDVTEVLNGTSGSPVDSPYTSDVVHSQDGSKIGMCFGWRSSGIADTQQNLCFIQSADGGVTWTDVQGNALTLPLTRATSPIAYPTSIADNGFQSTNLDWDSNGIPHLTTLMWDSTGATNVLHVYWTGSAWANEFVTFGTWKMQMNAANGLIDDSIGRPGVVCTSKGDTFIVWRSIKDGKKGNIRIVDVTQHGNPVEFVLAALDVGYGNQLHFDVDTVRSTGVAKLLINQQPSGGNTLDPTYGDALNWQAQWGALLSVDLTRVRQVAPLQSGRPKLRPIASASLPLAANPSIASATEADVASSPTVAIDPAWAAEGRVVLAKLTATVIKATGGTGTVFLSQRKLDGTGVVDIGSVTSSVVGAAQTLSTPWVPVSLGSVPAGGLMGLRFKSSDTNALTLTNATLQLAAIEGVDGSPIGSTVAQAVYTVVSAEDSFTQLISAPLYLDWDVSVITGQTNNSAIVSPWLTDKSGNGRVAAQSGALAVPTYIAAGIGGKPSLSFAGAQVLALPGISAQSSNLPYTFTLVAVCVATVAGAQQQIMVMDGGNSITNRIFQFRYGSATQAQGIGFSGSLPNAYTANSGAIVAANPAVITMIRTAYAIEVFVNGVSGGAVASVGDPTAGTNNPLFVGAQAFSGSIALPLTGQIARLLAFTDVLTTADRHTVERGLGAKYGIAVA